MVVDGLVGLMKNVRNSEEFRGFRLNGDVSFDLLQFVDDTIIMTVTGKIFGASKSSCGVLN